MKKIWLGVGILLTVYLSLPGPQLPPPDLPESLKSTEPGDTVQIKNLSAYFTDKNRNEVIEYYQNYFSRSAFLNIPLPVVRLNHPPEYAKVIIIDTIKTYYLEELVIPFKQSLFINGFDWQKDVFTPEEGRKKNRIEVDGKIWQAKITLKWFSSNVFIRSGLFWMAWVLIWIIGKEIVRELRMIND